MTRKKTTFEKLTPAQQESIREQVAEVRRRAMGLAPVVSEVSAVSAPETRVKKQAPRNTIGGSRPKYDYQEIANRWSQGVTAKEICKELGCAMSTVQAALKKIRPEGYDGKSGPRRIDFCKRGHDMSIHGKPIASGGRYCSECGKSRGKKDVGAKAAA